MNIINGFDKQKIVSRSIIMEEKTSSLSPIWATPFIRSSFFIHSYLHYFTYLPYTHTQTRLCFSFVMMKSNIPFSRFIAQQPQLPAHLPKCANCSIIGSAKMDQTITESWQSNEINRIPSSRRHSCPSVLDSLVNFPDLIATCSGIDLSRVFLGQFLQNTIRFERERVYKRKF